MVLLTAFEVARFDDDVAVGAMRAKDWCGTRISSCVIEELLAMRARSLKMWISCYQNNLGKEGHVG